jgi:uncharacterized protein
MPLTIYRASVPVFCKGLASLSNILALADAHVIAEKLDAPTLIGSRLAPDMFPLARQVQIASDHAKVGAARLASAKAPVFADDETTFDQLRTRIGNTIEYISGLVPAAFDELGERTISLKTGGRDVSLQPSDYLFVWLLPNFFFHVTTAYDILRLHGVPLGKRHFLGDI